MVLVDLIGRSNFRSIDFGGVGPKQVNIMRRNQPCRTGGNGTYRDSGRCQPALVQVLGMNFGPRRRLPRLATAAVERAVADGQNELPPGFRPPSTDNRGTSSRVRTPRCRASNRASEFPGSSPRWPWRRRRLDFQPVLGRRLQHGRGPGGWPFSGARVVGVGPGEDLFDGQRWRPAAGLRAPALVEQADERGPSREAALPLADARSIMIQVSPRAASRGTTPGRGQ